ncbi:MAG: DUF1080 domain-containing protein [Sedimentisphaerales bacterium]|nr:DUF1080 domain-containing protein [Sedimentisphaerales bacterium]
MTEKGDITRSQMNVVVLSVIVLLMSSCVGPLLSRSLSDGREEMEALDTAMGDWQGSITIDNEESPLVAQVIALGNSQYQAKILSGFDMRIDPIVELKGQQAVDKVLFMGMVMEGKYRGSKWQGAIEDEAFTGIIKGPFNGSFALQKVFRPCPTLGARPPKEAIVLFTGSDFDAWRQVREQIPGRVPLNSMMPVDNCAAYLMSYLWSDKEQIATLELGSDDGIKVWLNNKVVHANNALRALQAGEDKAGVTLNKGINALMLKVTQGSGGWEACARLADANDNKKPLMGVKNGRSAKEAQEGIALEENNGYITAWQYAGPYEVEGKGAEEIFDVAFAPEKEPDTVKWQDYQPIDQEQVAWKLIHKAMEVTPGSGSLISRQSFQDFQLHLEFRTPFMPDARGQGRGNSGVYLQGRYEVQILDSYALEGADNECGGIYTVARPRVNMCKPPMQWQTYDITFHGPRFDTAGRKLKNARLTVLHNGVTIHENQEVPGPTGSALLEDEREPAGIYLQDHGNPVQYRNIWLVELSE